MARRLLRCGVAAGPMFVTVFLAEGAVRGGYRPLRHPVSYRRAICAVCNSDSEVVEQVRRTVIHEVGHHFGIGDARLRELGW